ncbi:MAG: aminoglycoside phosphotransferase family protein [Bacteroidales bacterium]|nr:aminoglycoside phosphotransferase family protein [Bacteroidales bacterium]MCF8458252.1 aminoglycoside phosphotransferase family protein [Bacteroidales bacterium]
MQHKLQTISEKFLIKGNFISANPFGSGHINDTYLITTSAEKYILQRINHHIFKEVEKMNQNIIKALEHFNEKQKISKDIRFRELKIILSKNGHNHFKDEDGNYWRMMNFVSGSVSFDVAKKPEMAYEAAKAFGYFRRNLIDVDPDDFYPVIPDFHNLEMRMSWFHKVLETNSESRNQFAENEIEFVLSREHLSKKLSLLLKSGRIPIRVTHNDTKINNVLLDKDTLKGIAVIDLDTIMPGTVLFDFGDMVRTFISPAEEDETDLSKVVLRLDIFESLAKGYLLELQHLITYTERDHLVFGGKIMTYMIGLRFLTDFLEGDVYYKTARPNHNLDRCRTQFRLLSEIEKNETAMNSIIDQI